VSALVKGFLLRHDVATGLISTWLRFTVQEITRGILTEALALKAAHGFSYWDSAIIVAARALVPRALFGGHEPWKTDRRRHDHQSVSLSVRFQRWQVEHQYVAR
jgi:hypothetical protein